MSTADPAADVGVFDPLNKGLRRDALGLAANTVIGIASTAPAYGLAAAVPALAAAAGVHSPGVLALAALPMLCVALAFRELNLHEPDAGTTFAWVSRAFGPRMGWLGGWALVVSCLLVMGTLAQVAAKYTLLLVGAEELAGNRVVQVVGGLLWIAVLTVMCERGVRVTVRSQALLLLAELGLLAVFAVVALVKVATGSGSGSPAGPGPSLAWLNPFGAGGGGLASGLLLAVFLYWGWDSSFSVNEETRQRTRLPGIGALATIGVLIVTFLAVAYALIAYAGPARIAAEGDGDVFAAFASSVLGGPGGRLLVFAILTSAVAGTLTTILPAARTVLAMGVFGALPPAYARISTRTASPSAATWAIGIASAAVFLLFLALSQDALTDSVEATAMAICFYYGLTSLAVPWYFRGHWHGARNLLLRAVLPLLGGASMVVLLLQSGVVLGDPDVASSNLLGIGTPLIVAVAALVLGLTVMALVQRRYPAFFAGRLAGPGDVDADGRIRLRE